MSIARSTLAIFISFIFVQPLKAQSPFEIKRPADLSAVLKQSGDQIDKSLLPGKSNDLTKNEGQNNFLNTAKVLDLKGPELGLAQAIAAWKSLDPRATVPLPALKLMLDETFKVAPASPDLVLPASIFHSPLGGINRQEVEPDVAADTIRSGYNGNVPEPPLLSSLNNPLEKKRQSTCGNAVRKLRERVKYESFEDDRIAGFENICLFSGYSRNPPTLTSPQRKASVECAAVYQDFKDQCLSDIDQQVVRDQLNRVSGIFYLKRETPPENKGFLIICSGTAVSPTLILTARHCLTELLSFDINSVSLRFRNINTDRDDRIVNVRMPPDYQHVALAKAISVQADWMSGGNFDADIALLEVERAVANGSPPSAFPETKPPAEFKPTILASFQRLLVNLMLLKARLNNRPLFDDSDLLRSNDWTKAFGFDASPTCTLLRMSPAEAAVFNFDTSKVWGDFCQSLDTSSGGGLLQTRDNDISKLVVSAVVSRALRKYDLRAEGVAVESEHPNNAVVIVNEQLSNAIPN